MLNTLTEEEAGIKEQLQEAINSFNDSFPSKSQESVVHSAARNNQLKLLKRFKFFNASFDSYNNKRQKPVEVVMECGHLEVALYLMENTCGFYPCENHYSEIYLTTYSHEPNLRKKCYEFPSNQPTESINALKENYSHVFKILEDLGHLEAEDILEPGDGLPAINTSCPLTN